MNKTSYVFVYISYFNASYCVNALEIMFDHYYGIKTKCDVLENPKSFNKMNPKICTFCG